MLNDEFIEYVDNSPEIICFLMVNEFGGLIWSFEKSLLSSDKVRKKDLDSKIEDLREKQSYIVSTLPRFGVTPYTGDGDVSDEYKKWFEWWDLYLSSLKYNELKDIDNGLRNSNFSFFHPAKEFSDQNSIEERLASI